MVFPASHCPGEAGPFPRHEQARLPPLDRPMRLSRMTVSSRPEVRKGTANSMAGVGVEKCVWSRMKQGRTQRAPTVFFSLPSRPSGFPPLTPPACSAPVRDDELVVALMLALW